MKISEQIIKIEIKAITEKWYQIGSTFHDGTILPNDGDIELVIHPTLWKAIGDSFEARGLLYPSHGIPFTCELQGEEFLGMRVIQDEKTEGWRIRLNGEE